MTTPKKASPKKNIHQRLHSVMMVLNETLVREDRKGVPFKVLLHDKVTRFVRKPLLDAGIYWESSAKNWTLERHEYYLKGPKVTILSNVVVGDVVTTFYNIDNPEEFVTVTTGSSGRADDDAAKAFGKFMSYGAKYNYLKGLGLYTGDEAEPEVEMYSNTEPPAPAADIPRVKQSLFAADPEQFQVHMERLTGFCQARDLEVNRINQDIVSAHSQRLREMTESELNEVHRWCEDNYEQVPPRQPEFTEE